MTSESDTFDKIIRAALAELGAGAPAGPSATAVHARVRRRKRARRTVALASLGVLVAGLIVSIHLAGASGRTRSPRPAPELPRPVVSAPHPDPNRDRQPPQVSVNAPEFSPEPVVEWLPEPIAPDASPARIRASVRGYFRMLGVSSAYVSKRADGLSFAFADSPAPAARVEAELGALLSHFDFVTVRLAGDDFSCSLVRLE